MGQMLFYTVELIFLPLFPVFFQDGELPDDVDWNFVFKVQEGEVYRVCPPVNPQFRKRRFHMNKSALDEAEDRFAHLTETEWKKTYCKKLRSFKGRVENLHLGPLRIPHEHHLQRVSLNRHEFCSVTSNYPNNT